MEKVDMITPKSGIEKCPECGQPVKAIDLRRLGIKCSKYDRWEIEHMNYEHGCGKTMHGMTKKELVNAWNRYAKKCRGTEVERPGIGGIEMSDAEAEEDDNPGAGSNRRANDELRNF